MDLTVDIPASTEGWKENMGQEPMEDLDLHVCSLKTSDGVNTTSFSQRVTSRGQKKHPVDLEDGQTGQESLPKSPW